MMAYANIVSTGAYVPEIEMTNARLRERFAATAPEFVDKMEAASGIRTRWYAPDEWSASDLALRATQEALARANKSPEDLDLIILGTDSPDYITPATSVVLQGKLGAKNAGTFDVGCACASFPTALANAAGLMATNRALKNVLVVSVYQMHKLANASDPMIFFYGDGAGAAVLERGDAPGFVAAAFAADGTYANRWLIQAGGTVEPASEAAAREGRTLVRMLERYPPEINNDGWPKLVRRVAENGGFAVGDIDFVIFTQVRKPTIELVMANLELPMSKTHTVMEKWGYTGSACIPMALDDALREKKIKPGDLVVLVGSGVGYNQAAVALRMPAAESRLFGN
ncbi:MAG: ketoacyl-ACP synthase III [Acidobacteria bacterium]|nr:ketoacyl-ACP synthase III [Acidobacteriota bacterium]MBV9476375.1 ketoacyl-ACP synthase III [Acidobacteriota bacterium]